MNPVSHPMHFLITLVILILGYTSSHAEDLKKDYMVAGFMTVCDTDNSKSVSEKELSGCLFKIIAQDKNGPTAPDAIKFLNLVDTNKDGKITPQEYRVMLELMERSNQERGEAPDDDGAATFQARDGSTRKISREELEGMLQQSQAQQAQINGQSAMGKVEKRRTLDEIAADDPEMAKFIAVVKWSIDRLRDRGNIVGELLQMQTLPAGGSNFRDARTEGGKPTGAVDWSGLSHADIWFEFSTTSTSSPGEQVCYEVHLERNPAIYRRPYLALRGAWSLDANGKRQAELPIPKPRLSRTPAAHGEVNTDEGEFRMTAIYPIIGLAMLAVWSIRGFVGEWLEVRAIKRRLAQSKKDD